MAQPTHARSADSRSARWHGVTLTVEEAARSSASAERAAYEAARRGELPTRRLGRRLFVPVPALLEWLGVARPPEGEAAMQGHIHKRARTPRDGKTTTLGTSSSTSAVDGNGRRRQKWHGGFRTRQRRRGRASSRSSTTSTPAPTSSRPD